MHSAGMCYCCVPTDAACFTTDSGSVAAFNSINIMSKENWQILIMVLHEHQFTNSTIQVSKDFSYTIVLHALLQSWCSTASLWLASYHVEIDGLFHTYLWFILSFILPLLVHWLFLLLCDLGLWAPVPKSLMASKRDPENNRFTLRTMAIGQLFLNRCKKVCKHRLSLSLYSRHNTDPMLLFAWTNAN